MKKKLAITIATASIAVLLFFASACAPSGGLFGFIRYLYSLTRQTMEDNKNREKADFIEELVEEAIEDESGEKVEEDPEGSETSPAGDGDGANDEQGNIQSDDGEDCDCSGDDGGIIISTGSDLPEGFPGNIPIHSDIQITRSWKAIEEGKDVYSVSAVSDKSVDEIFNWYKDKFSGWEISGEYTNYIEDDKASTFTARDGTYVVTIIVMETKDEGTITIVRYIVKEE